MPTQSVILKRSKFRLNEAKHWIEEHGYKNHGVDATPHYYRFRQIDPARLKAMGLVVKTVPLGDDGYLINYY
jgi:hypothetical protein